VGWTCLGFRYTEGPGFVTKCDKVGEGSILPPKLRDVIYGRPLKYFCDVFVAMYVVFDHVERAG